MATLLQIRNATREILNDTVDSSIYSDTIVDQAINDSEVKICNKQKYSFLKTKQIYNGVANTALSSDITTASTVLAVNDTTNYPASGYVSINQDIIAYTGKTSTTLTGCTGIDISHNAGSTVIPVLPIPSDFNREPTLDVYKGSNMRPLQYQFVDEFDFWTSKLVQKFTIVSDDDGSKYLMFYNISVTDSLVFKYLRKPTTLVNNSDVSLIPDPYALMIIPTFAAARCQMLRGDNIDNEATNKENYASQDLFEMNKHYAEEDQGVRGFVRSAYTSRRTELYGYKNSIIR